MKESLPSRIINKLLPPVEGKIVDIRRDSHKHDIFHFLIETKTGERKEVLEFENTLFVSVEGIKNVNLFNRYRLGGWYSSDPILPSPIALFGKLEKDPFKQKK